MLQEQLRVEPNFLDLSPPIEFLTPPKDPGAVLVKDRTALLRVLFPHVGLVELRRAGHGVVHKMYGTR